jgi:hypothetical protein
VDCAAECGLRKDFRLLFRFLGDSMADSSAPASGATGIDRIAEAHERLLQEPGLQFQFEALPPPPTLPEWLLAVFRFLGRLQPLFEVVFWTAIAGLAGLIIFFAAREALRYYRGRKPHEAGTTAVEPDWRPPAARARALLSDADRLAAEGRFAEAVHLLLFRSIEDIDAKRPHAVKPALTSRDILALGSLPAVARRALERLVAAVEWSYFGGRPVDATAFSECRRAYEEFAFPDSWAEATT